MMLTRSRSRYWLLLCLVMAIDANVANAAKPFCMYSLQNGWSDKGPFEYVTHRAGPNDRSGIPEVVKRIMQALRFRADFEVYIAEAENNAFAAVASGKKILVVDVDFLESINRQTRTDWGAIQVVAHEIGHHIAGFSRGSHENELNADYWSGLALRRLGAAKGAATQAILAIGGDVDSPSHPNKHRRARMIENGWDDDSRGRIDYTHCDGCR